MYTVYVLKDNQGKSYKGMTSNLHRRLAEHKAGGVRTTRKMYGIKVVYSEKYKEIGEARAREKYLKTAAGRRFLKIKIDMGH